MVQFWHKFIKNLAAKTIFLTESLKTKGEFQWTDDMAKELEQLKEDLTTKPVLSYVKLDDGGGDFIVYTDASDLTCSFALNQIQYGEEKAIAYGSAKFNETQRRYDIFCKELYAIKHALTKLRHLLLGKTFILKTDSQAVFNCILPKAKLARDFPSPTVGRWFMDILSFDFKLVKIAGSENVIADSLSRIKSEKIKEIEEKIEEDEDPILFNQQAENSTIKNC